MKGTKHSERYFPHYNHWLFTDFSQWLNSSYVINCFLVKWIEKSFNSNLFIVSIQSLIEIYKIISDWYKETTSIRIAIKTTAMINVAVVYNSVAAFMYFVFQDKFLTNVNILSPLLILRSFYFNYFVW